MQAARCERSSNGETASGWQEATLSTPVAVSARTVYVASYHTNSGHAADVKWFSTLPAYFFDPTGIDNTPLHLVDGSGAGGPNGISAQGPSSFPTQAGQDDNYFVDVVFSPSGS